MLSILLLGPPSILLHNNAVDLPRRKSRALLYYIAARAMPTTREHLLSVFWPDHERAAAQQVLRTSLHGLRKALGPALVINNDQLEFLPDTFIDSRRFEAEVAAPKSREQLALTLALYRGPLLEHFSLPDSEEFERWLEVEREHVQQLALHGFLQLAQMHEEQQNFPAALSTLTRALGLDPLHEELQRATMRVQYRLGDRASAIRRYEQLRDQLDMELGVPPMPETQAMYDAIITDTFVDAPTTSGNQQPVTSLRLAMPLLNQRVEQPAKLPFTGRSAELARVSAAAANGKLVFVEGEPGIGKTRLSEEWLQQQRALVLRGAAYELEKTLPYQPFIEALRELCEHPEWKHIREQLQLAPVWRTEVARLLPELGDSHAAPPADESRLWEGVRQMLHALAQQVPVIVFLDDLHWADESTLALLGYLVRQRGDAPIHYLATGWHANNYSHLVGLMQTLTRANLLERIKVQRLTIGEMRTLAHRLSATHDDLLASWLNQTAEGNPYMIAELLRYSRERGWFQPNGMLDVQALVAEPVVPQSLYSLIESRLMPLSPQARRILNLAVAVGREFDFPVVARAAGFAETAVLDAFDELRGAGLIRPTEDQRFSFDHTLTMEVAYRQVGEPRHRLMHREVAEAMEQVYSDRLDEVAGLLASHFAEGNEPQRAAPYALRAGHRAMSLAAWQEAVAFFQQALRGTDENQHLEALIELGEAQYHAGALAQSAETFQHAIRLAEQRNDQQQWARARLALARALLPQGRYNEIIATIQPLLNTGEAASAEFLWGAALSLEGAHLPEASAHLQRSAELLTQHPQPNGINLARVKFELGNIAAQQGDLAHAIKLYREVLHVEQDAPGNEVLPWFILAHNNLAYHLHLLGDPSAIEHARIALTLANEKGMLAVLPYVLSTMGEILLAAGDLDGAERSFKEGLALSEQTGLSERVAGITANQGLVAIKRGETALAIHLLSTALAHADALGTRHLATQIRVWLAPLLPPEQARATLAEARMLAESGGRKRLLDDIERLETRLAK